VRYEDGRSPPADPHALIVARDSASEVVLADIEVATAVALGNLGEGGILTLSQGERNALLHLGLIVPVAWDIVVE
jgi:hypothetical protein